MKDYYKILEVTKSSTEDEIRKNYRKLAMQYHPDRNPDSPEAEEKFKEVAEAYGVLTDPVKKRQYNRWRASGKGDFSSSNGTDGFSYSQEDILRDLFRDPRFQRMFRGLLHEFQRSGFRSSSNFVRKSFFNGKGGIFFGGIFLFGSLAGPMISKATRKTLSGNSPLLKSVSTAVGSILKSGQQESRPEKAQNSGRSKQLKHYDTTYHTPLTPEELKRGKTIQVVVYGDTGEQTLRIKIPPGSTVGGKLRIKGKGRPGPYGRGDLYLSLVHQNTS
ncbi:MAG: hypothetical protein BA862_12390 [Desulfobulbaceae bacterium S3730MH12]|nr:MAG: hypothetical protein BA862_12390 [Desulfobulbaceae bacterium S3730MH12]OEU79950.1 MAG: hypothetical protein BA873_08000 [Desulfobulbaceae bacterium C00003063]